MVQLAHDGLELWYATPDAPAPDGTTEKRQGVSVTVGVRPANPSNAVSVRYRVDGRGVGTVSAPLVANDFQKRTQYFRATFPTFWSGETVEYLPVVSCEGRRAPGPAMAGSFPTSFQLGELPAPRLPSQRPADLQAEFPVRLEYLSRTRVHLTKEPEFFGETPAGFLINWPPASGTLDGPALRARVIPGGDHRTIIRTDGIGILNVSVRVETHDHVAIDMQYTATVDFGEDWAAWLPLGKWPASLPVRSQILMLTADRKYRWLNRLHCLGVGEARLPEYFYTYDMYAVR